MNVILLSEMLADCMIVSSNTIKQKCKLMNSVDTF